MINNKYIIKSLPQRILKNVLYGGHKLLEPLHTKNVTDDDELDYTHHHVVYKLPSSDQYKDQSKLFENFVYSFLGYLNQTVYAY